MVKNKLNEEKIPKISIIIPVYNTEKYLERCLKTVINQSLKEIEIIIVNDCSPDNSLEIIKKFEEKDRRIILIDKEKNEGLSEARNSGIKLAKGEYILHVDSDDWIEPNYFEDVYNLAKKENADVVITDFFIDYDNGEFFIQSDQKNQNGLELNKKQTINNIVLGKSFPCVWNKLFKRELYIKGEISHPKGKSLGEDLYVTPKLLFLANKIIKLNKAYYHYIQNNSSITKTRITVSKLKDIDFVLSGLNEFFKDKDIDIDILDFNYRYYNDWIYQVKYDFEDSEYIQIYNKFIEIIKKITIKEEFSLRARVFGKILKFTNNKYIFILLWNVDKLYKRIKGIK